MTITTKRFDVSLCREFDPLGKEIAKDFLSFHGYSNFKENDETNGKPLAGYWDVSGSKGNKTLRIGTEVKTSGWSQVHLKSLGVPFSYQFFNILTRTLKEASDYHIFVSPCKTFLFACPYDQLRKYLHIEYFNGYISSVKSLHAALIVEDVKNPYGIDTMVRLNLKAKDWKMFGRFYQKQNNSWIEL